MDVSQSILEKGKKLVEEKRVMKDVDSEKRIHFKVLGDTEEHIVIYDKNKNTYECDCSFNTLKYKECSHIVGCKIVAESSNNLPSV